MTELTEFPATSTERGTIVANAFDYIIVGAGSAGCVIARRLVDQTEARVLVLEAGGSDEGIDRIFNPLRWLENIGSPQDYLYQYQPTPLLNNRVIYAPRGKVLGGSGSINAMIWARGNASDYDGWASAGNTGWGYKSVLPLFKKVEDWEGGETDFHGVGGPIHVESCKKLHFVDSAMIEAGISFGMPYHDDINGINPFGVGPLSLNVANGQRSSPYRGYLYPVMNRKNLTVLTGAVVQRLNLVNDRCVGLDYVENNAVHTVTATKEIILCAGSIETPRLLMLSGIGNSSELENLAIKTKVDLPGVGKNLQDHPLVSVTYEAKDPLGQLTYDLGGSNFFWKSSPTVPKSDLMLVPIQVGIETDEISKQHPVPPNAFSVFVTLVDSRSKGFLRMKSSEIDGPLEIQPNFLQEPDDLDALTSGIELCMELADQPALRHIIRNWVAPTKRINRQGIKAFIRDACSTYFHPVGTCAMGTGADAVVNPELKVYGVDGLRIADASIMPQITTSNTNAPTLMIGEFAAELILGNR